MKRLGLALLVGMFSVSAMAQDSECTSQNPIKGKNFFDVGDVSFYEDGRTVCVVGQSSWNLSVTLKHLEMEYLSFQKKQNLDTEEVNRALDFIKEKLTEERGRHMRIDLRYDVESQEGELVVFDNGGNNDIFLGSMNLSKKTVLGLMYENERKYCGPVDLISKYY
ncbi:MAG: hypothetical protein ABIG93_05615 [archaeon]|nr:hypothetical protein [Nanoarchaeota archaeon]